MQDFKFTFETDAEQFAAERKGCIDSYDCVRMVVDQTDYIEDFPVKNREEFSRLMETYKGNIEKVYQTVHSYDIMDYM